MIMMEFLQKLKNEYRPETVPELKESETQWFRDAKFGLFMHWGLYSLLGRGEWAMFNDRISAREYAKLADRFSAPQFDPKQWAEAAKRAGMKYMVLTARHHDGFSLFDSKASAFNSVNAAVRRDIVGEYVKACREAGLKVGIYYSPMDWRFPGYFFPELYADSALAMRDQCQRQLEELMTQYGKIDLLWFDGEWLAHGGIKFGPDGWYRDPDYGSDELYFKINYFWQSEKMLRKIREWQPGILINNRFGWKGDFHIRERRIGGIRTDKPWESCDTLARSWGWMPGQTMLSLRECIQNLISTVVRDGNYLMNLGPTPEGCFEPRYVERIAQIGGWLGEYGETVYGTRGGPVEPGPWGGTTYKGSTVYVHITEWTDDVIRLPGLKNTLVRAEGLTSEHVKAEQKGDTVEISVPAGERHPYDTIVALRFDAPVRWEGVKAAEQDIYGLADGLN